MKNEDRILFLKGFTRELILNSKPADSENQEKIIEQPEEKIIRPLLPSIGITASQDLNAIKKTIQESTRDLPRPEPFQRSIGDITETKPVSLSPVEPVIQRLTIDINDQPASQPQIPQSMLRQQPRQQFIEQDMPQIPQMNQFDQEFRPQPRPLPYNFDLGKLNRLVEDPRVTVIECQGPGRLVIARIYGKPSATRMSLTQQEINSIIERFSQESRIPIVAGLFKATVGNLILTGVISELVGSRFIITKMSNAFSINQMNHGY